jgi:hypothetical protein
VAINVLPDDVLLEIFNFYVDQRIFWEEEEVWHTLVHVCQRWRYVVFASPHRLLLRLFCTNRTPVKRLLRIWPALPIVIKASGKTSQRPGMANVIAALTKRDRVYEIFIKNIPNSLLKKMAAMKKPFPALTKLWLLSDNERAPVLSGSFLGGSPPRLQSVSLDGIPFPGLGKLLLSTTDLVLLRLRNIPRSGCISAEAMGAILSTLARIEQLELGFRSPRSRADRENRHPPPLTRIVLPVLSSLEFQGDIEYLEDIVSRFDAPLLHHAHIVFFNQLIFDTPQLRQFISRTERYKAPDHTDVVFHDSYVTVAIFPPDETGDDDAMLDLIITCKPSDWQLSSLAQVCTSALSTLPTLERLHITDYRQDWEEDMENSQWLELLRAFTSIKDLFLYEKLFGLVAPALEELAGENIAELLPTLQNLFLQGPLPSELFNKAIGEFISARQLSDCPVTVHHRDSEDLDYIHWEVGDR